MDKLKPGTPKIETLKTQPPTQKEGCGLESETPETENSHNLQTNVPGLVWGANGNLPLDPTELTPQKTFKVTFPEENAELTQNDVIAFVSEAIEDTGLIGPVKDSFNEFLDKGLPHIIMHIFDYDKIIKDNRDKTDIDKKRESIRIRVKWTGVEIGRPVYPAGTQGLMTNLYPNDARTMGHTYAAPLHLSAEIKLTATYNDGRKLSKTSSIRSHRVSSIPIIVGCNRCHTYNCTRQARKDLKEDPNDLGGYFIAKRGEYIADMLENIRYNALHVHANMVSSERVRGDYISQLGGPYENSSQVVVRYMTNGAITIEINSVRLQRAKIPFYLIYRAFAMTSDRDIVETIVLDLASKSPVVQRISDILDQALHIPMKEFEDLVDVSDQIKVVEKLAEKLEKFLNNRTAYKNVDNAVKYMHEMLLKDFDRYLFPHMGTSSQVRIRKLRLLGRIIYKTLLVDMEILPPTDRDSYRNKRIHGAGVSLAKAFKTQFNNSVVKPVLAALKREVKNNPFERVTSASIANAFQGPLSGSDLNRTLEQAITSGNKIITIRRRQIRNRVSTQSLERKNNLNVLTALRTINAHSGAPTQKQTERADMMRRVHPSMTGYICVARSADTGEKVGMQKELACTASVTTAGESYALKLRLLSDPDVTPLDDVVNPDILRLNLAAVYVNGEWIGCCRDSPNLIKRYRALRREGRIVSPMTSIVWDPVVDEVEFLLDVGRLIRPLLIVRSNIDDYDEACRKAFEARRKGEKDWKKHKIEFVQNISLTRDHIDKLLAGELSLEDLLVESVIEYITAEEQHNCYLANSLIKLREHQHDITSQFTHCDTQQSIFGIAALVSPLGNHTQPARVTYETNQARQTGGWHSAAAPYRADKNRYFQFVNEVPLVTTLAHRFVIPNGMNTIVAYMSYGGDNQEDSAILNKGSIDLGLFEGYFTRYEIAELDKREEFRNPDLVTTKRNSLKTNASYEKLVDGFVPVGTIVRKGDVLIGRVTELTRERRGDSQEKYVDHSIIYKWPEPARVEAVWRPRGPTGEKFGLVKLRYERPLRVGDKMSSRSGNKSIAAILLPSSDMPFTESGLTPDIIVNPHSIPSRMTIGQMLETSLSKVCARKGVITDGTCFRTISPDEIASELVKHGFRYNGRECMHNGMTGDVIDAAIFIGPTYHQRLQKFVLDDEYAVGDRGPTDTVTNQPLAGKNVQGGLRIGEMEAWVLEAHGSMMSQYEKFNIDSDGMMRYVCRNCGNPAVYNNLEGIYLCKVCGGSDFGGVISCKSSIVLQEELGASNIKMKMCLKPREVESGEHPLPSPPSRLSDVLKRKTGRAEKPTEVPKGSGVSRQVSGQEFILGGSGFVTQETENYRQLFITPISTAASDEMSSSGTTMISASNTTTTTSHQS